LRDELGDKLYIDKNSSKWIEFPSPKALRGKILIRDKDQADDADTKEEEKATAQLEKKQSKKQMKNWEKLDKEAEDGKGENNEFKDLITIVNTKHKEAAKSERAMSFSRGESSFEDLIAMRQEMIAIAQRHLIRTYPSGKVGK
jgi:hypothetical protein